ncbi:MAG: GDP-L-fucose synthase [Nitrospirae bacterium]|nr:GDP-L-fucose synthase [Nitrospirota bacterium]
MFSDSKIFVAGHNGLLGSAICKKLIASGYTNIITRPHKELDLTNQASVDSFFSDQRPQYVFLCAGLTGGIMANNANPAAFLYVNTAIQNNVFNAVVESDVRHLIFYGSTYAYPKNCPQPMKEGYFLTGAIEATSEGYAAAKIAGIIACRSYNKQFKTNKFIAVIPNTMYGANDNFDIENSHVVSALIRKFHDAKTSGSKKVILWGSGQPKREFIYSEDVADISIYLMNNAESLENSHYNIGSGRDYSIKELASIISNIVGFNGEIEWDMSKPDGAMRKLLDSSKILKLINTPFTEIEHGLKMTYAWYLDNCIS